MTISVMIPTKNRSESLKKTLNSLKLQTFKDFELVVVDGGSTDGTKKLVGSYSNYFPIVWKVASGGLIPQMNVAYKVAKGDYVVRTDDDVIFHKDWLKEIVATFKSDTKVGGVTGPTVIPDEFSNNRDLFFFEKKLKTGNLFWKLIGDFYFNYIMEGQAYRVSHWCKSGAFTLGSNYPIAYDQPLQEVNNLEACNWAVRRKLLVKVGGFDPIFSGIGEYNEPDTSFKIMNLGYKLMFNPKARLNHCPSKEGFFKDRPSSYPRMINYIIFYFRHIKVSNLDYLLRFFSYVFFLNSFYFFQFLVRGQISQLGAIPGTFAGIFFVLKEKVNRL